MDNQGPGRELQQLRAVDELVCEDRGEMKALSSPKDLLKRYTVELRFLDQGMLINIGCATFAFSSIEEGMAEVLKYTQSPQEQIEKYQ